MDPTAQAANRAELVRRLRAPGRQDSWSFRRLDSCALDDVRRMGIGRAPRAVEDALGLPHGHHNLVFGVGDGLRTRWRGLHAADFLAVAYGKPAMAVTAGDVARKLEEYGT